MEDKFRKGMSLSGVENINLTVTSNTYFEDVNLDKVMGNNDKDMAIFKLPKSYIRPDYKIKLGNSNSVRELDEIYLIGNPFDKGYVTRKGIIGNDQIIEFEGKEGNASSITALPGDSGGVLINSEGEVIGLATKSVLAYFIFSPINLYKEEIRKYEENQRVSRDALSP